MIVKQLRKCGPAAILAGLAVIALARPASAQTVYATSISTGTIYADNVATHVVTPVFNTGGDIDSLFFDPSGRIIYDQLDAGKVFAYNPATNSNVLLFSQNGSQPIDMALSPT